MHFAMREGAKSRGAHSLHVLLSCRRRRLRRRQIVWDCAMRHHSLSASLRAQNPPVDTSAATTTSQPSNPSHRRCSRARAPFVRGASLGNTNSNHISISTRACSACVLCATPKVSVRCMFCSIKQANHA